MIILKNFSKPLAVLSQIMAFLTIIILGLLYLNQVLPFQFLTGNLLTKLTYIKDYAVIITTTTCGLSFAIKWPLIIFIPFCLLAVCALACYSISIFG